MKLAYIAAVVLLTAGCATTSGNLADAAYRLDRSADALYDEVRRDNRDWGSSATRARLPMSRRTSIATLKNVRLARTYTIASNALRPAITRCAMNLARSARPIRVSAPRSERSLAPILTSSGSYSITASVPLTRQSVTDQSR